MGHDGKGDMVEGVGHGDERGRGRIVLQWRVSTVSIETPFSGACQELAAIHRAQGVWSANVGVVANFCAPFWNTNAGMEWTTCGQPWLLHRLSS